MIYRLERGKFWVLFRDSKDGSWVNIRNLKWQDLNQFVHQFSIIVHIKSNTGTAILKCIDPRGETLVKVKLRGVLSLKMAAWIQFVRRSKTLLLPWVWILVWDAKVSESIWEIDCYSVLYQNGCMDSVCMLFF